MIFAEIQTDECHQQCHAIFDATPFFEQATLGEILGLKFIGWGGDYQADAVALFMLERDAGVAKVFHFLDLHPSTADGYPLGFEVQVREADVARWVFANRPEWFPRIWDDEGRVLAGHLSEHVESPKN